jgi:hypothetical protein
VKAGCLVAGMIAGADSIDDMDLLRHGATPVVFGGIRATSTLGPFLRSFTWGGGWCRPSTGPSPQRCLTWSTW